MHALLRHLEQGGFTGAPKVLGTDREGREVVEYIPGEVPWPAAHRRLLGSVDRVARTGALLRGFHDAVADFDPGEDAIWQFPEMAADAAAHADERGLIICHNDPTAWNLVINARRWAFIDWDAAGPRPAIWDVAYCAIGVIPISPDTVKLGWPGPVPVDERLSALAAGYLLESRDPQAAAAGDRGPHPEQLRTPAAARRGRYGSMGHSVAFRTRRVVGPDAGLRGDPRPIVDRRAGVRLLPARQRGPVPSGRCATPRASRK